MHFMIRALNLASLQQATETEETNISRSLHVQVSMKEKIYILRFEFSNWAITGILQKRFKKKMKAAFTKCLLNDVIFIDLKEGFDTM